MPGRYNKVLLRKGLARHAAQHEEPAPPELKRVRARAQASAEEQLLLGDLMPAPEPEKFPPSPRLRRAGQRPEESA